MFDPAAEDDGSGPADEYDCFRDPLPSDLLWGDSLCEVAEFLRDEPSGHFGLKPWLVTTNVIDCIYECWEESAT